MRTSLGEWRDFKVVGVCDRLLLCTGGQVQSLETRNAKDTPLHARRREAEWEAC